jgi:signal transduction histidine kinase/CheY-like chemotaxis protein/ligand-binding sensor domain-containing protein
MLGSSILRLVRMSVASAAASLLVAHLDAQGSVTIGGRLDESWRWVHFGEQDGLGPASVTSLADCGTRVWAGTDQGLQVYDGWSWRECGPELGLPRATTQSLAAASDGTVWLVTADQLFRGSEQGFAAIPLPAEWVAYRPVEVAPLDSGEIRVVVREIHGVQELLLAGPPDALVREALPPECSHAKRLSVRRTTSGRIWLATELGLFVLVQGGWRSWIDPGSAWKVELVELEESLDGRGLCGLRLATGAIGIWTWTAGSAPSKLEDFGPCMLQRGALGPDGTGLILLQSRECLTFEDGRWRLLPSPPEAVCGADLLRFRANGDLWVAIPGGLELCRLSSERWKHLRSPAIGSPLNRIAETLVARDGTVWAATFGGLLAWRSDGTLLEIPPAGGDPNAHSTGIAEDARGRIWTSSGARSTGLWAWDGEQWEHVEHDTDGRALGWIHKLRPAEGGGAWCLTLSDDLASVGGEHGSVQELVDGEVKRWLPADELSPRRYYDFCRTAEGELWFATSRGLVRWKDWEWREWGVAEGLRSVRIFRLAATRSGELYFSNEDFGLARVDRDGSIEYLDEEPGTVRRGRVWDLSFDDHERLWVSADSGLFLLRDGNWSSFEFHPGSSNPHTWPVLVTPDRVFAGAANGLFVLSLAEMDEAPPRAKIQRATIDADRALLRWSADAPWQGSSPTWLETRFRVDDEPWSSWSRSREVLRQHLEPGSHTFDVQAKGLFGQVGPTVAQAAFEVLPPLYSRSTFLVPVIGLSFALVALAGFTWRKRRAFVRRLRRSEAEQRALARRIDEAQRLESLGHLAGGIAHEFNNLLMVIQGTGEELAFGTSSDATLGRMRRAVGRASELTQQLLVYAGRGALQTSEVDLRAIVRQAIESLAPRLHDGIRLVRESSTEPLLVRADPSHLRQLVAHLLTNSIESIDRANGTVVVATSRARMGSALLVGWSATQLPPEQEWIVLCVKDDGAGMPGEVLDRAFEPFYSTRGEGRGLGLALVRGIALSHHGHVHLESSPGQGATFTLLLPTAVPQANGREPAAVLPSWSGRGSVLVVDDEDAVREVTSRMLQRQGFKVVEAPDGRAALRCLEEDPDEVACALVDLTMPGWNGVETVRALRERKPELRVLLVSGFSALDLEEAIPASSETSLLRKPFTLQELETEMRALLRPERG